MHRAGKDAGHLCDSLLSKEPAARTLIPRRKNEGERRRKIGRELRVRV